MRTKNRIRQRLGAWMLAALFLAQALLGVLPPMPTQAAVTAIEEWDENDLVDYQYRFNMKFQKGITKVEPFGCDNQDRDAFTNYGRSGMDAITHRMTPAYVPDSAGVRYYNVGKDGNGNIVDFQMSIVSVTNAEPRYDMLTPYNNYHRWKDERDDLGEGFAWENGMGQPIVAFSMNAIGMWSYCIGSTRVHFQFFKHNTNEPLPINGHGTVRDLDAGQGMYIPPDSNLDHVYILKGNRFLTVNGTSVEAATDVIDSSDKRGWLNFLYNTDNIFFSFVHQSRLNRWDKEREDGIARRGSVEKWAESMKKAYVDPDGNSYCPEFDGGKIVRGYAYFDFTSYCLGDIELKKAPEKRVGAVDCTWEEAAAASRDNPFPIQEFEEFQYMIQTELTPNHLSSFVVQDTLKGCLTIDGTSKVVVKDDAGDEVTGQFNVQIEGQTITCSAKEEYLRKEEFTNNQHYTFILKVHRKEGADVSDFLDGDGYTFHVPNSAVMSYVRTNGKGGSMTTETVWVQGKVTPNLVIEKAASRYEWAVGDEIEYIVKVTQKKPNAWAINTVVEDISIPPCLRLLDGQYFVETAPGVEHCVIEKSGENGWRVTCPLLQYDESIQITFRCAAAVESNGQEWVNTVSATAENFIDPASGEQKVVKDLAEVWPNTPELQIDKTVDKYEWRVGEEVTYRVVAANTQPGTIAKNVRVHDLELPQGLVLSGGAASVEVIGAPAQVEYPVADHKTGQATEVRAVETGLEADERGFSFYCSYLPYSYPVTILFHCTATEDSNGRESVNIAAVQADNAQEKADDAEAYINTGAFWIDKTADHYEWQLGDLVEYQVTVENQAVGTIARNVTIWDTDMPTGLALTGEDSVTILGIPEVIQDPVAGTPDTPNMLNPEAYQETVEKRTAYEFLPEGSGWRLNISDLPAGVPVTIRFLCSVTEEVNGMESINAAYVQAENAPEQSDDAEIYVNTAMLSIEKSVHNPYLELGDGREAFEFRVGEQAEYQVVVNNLQKGSIARNLVISDLSLPQGLVLDEAEDALMVYGIPQTIWNPVAGTDDLGNQLNPENYNEVEEKVVESRLERQNGGWVLTISDLPYNMPVTVVFRCNILEELNGWEVVNTARAYADNGAEVKDTSKIWVNSPVLKVEKTADKPFYKYGDIATYRIKVTQEQTGCVARGVTIGDVIETPGVRLLKDSIVLLDENGNLVDAGVEANDDNTFILYTNRALVKGSGYWIYDAEQGGACEQVLSNPLDLKSEKQMIVEYQAAVIDENLAGQTVRNVATADSQEHYPSTDDEEVEIHSPILDVVKESDQKEYYVGETGYYKLTIRQLREDVHADNIVIEDVLNHRGAVLLTDSILIKKNNAPLEGALIEASASGLRIVTNTNLSDADKLEVFYKVLFESPDLDGAAVVNTARAKGDNTPETVTENEVYVGDIRPVLQIEKTSDKEVYKPGDIGHYQVKVTQTEKDAQARKVVLRDVLKDELAKIVKGSVKLYDRNGVELDKPEIEATDTGYTIHTGMELGYQEYLIVKYDVSFPVDAQGKEVTNVALATADNMKPGQEKVPKPGSVGDGLTALKTAEPPSGSVVAENELITYFISVENQSTETKRNIIVKDALPPHVTFEKFGDEEGEILELDGVNYVTFLVEEIKPGGNETLSFTVKRGKAEPEDCIVNLAQVRATIANKEDITTETWKSPRFFNTNSTVHYADTLWVRDEHRVSVEALEPSVTPTPGISPIPSVTPKPTVKPTVTPRPTVRPTAAPTPTAAVCPKNTPIPTRIPSGGSSGGGTSGGGNNFGSGNGNPYGNYQGGAYAGNAKTGDTRPFQAMARVGILGVLLLICGVWLYRKGKKGRNDE